MGLKCYAERFDVDLGCSNDWNYNGEPGIHDNPVPQSLCCCDERFFTTGGGGEGRSSIVYPVPQASGNQLEFPGWTSDCLACKSRFVIHVQLCQSHCEFNYCISMHECVQGRRGSDVCHNSLKSCICKRIIFFNFHDGGIGHSIAELRQPHRAFAFEEGFGHAAIAIFIAIAVMMVLLHVDCSRVGSIVVFIIYLGIYVCDVMCHDNFDSCSLHASEPTLISGCLPTASTFSISMLMLNRIIYIVHRMLMPGFHPGIRELSLSVVWLKPFNHCEFYPTC